MSPRRRIGGKGGRGSLFSSIASGIALFLALPALAGEDADVLRRTARAGDGAAMLALGELYAAGGGGVARDAVTAHLWFSRAAELGVAGAEPRRQEMATRLGLDLPGECVRRGGGSAEVAAQGFQAAKGSASRGQ